MMMLPVLETRFFCKLTISVGSITTAGDTGFGTRRIIPILGGTVTGRGITGTILPFGADFQIVRGDGLIDLEAKYAFQMDDGSIVYIENKGIRFAAPEVLERLARGESVDPSTVYFRTVPKFETGADDHRWLMTRLFVGVGARYPDRVEVDVFEVM